MTTEEIDAKYFVTYGCSRAHGYGYDKGDMWTVVSRDQT